MCQREECDVSNGVLFDTDSNHSKSEVKDKPMLRELELICSRKRLEANVIIELERFCERYHPEEILNMIIRCPQLNSGVLEQLD